MKVKSLIQPLLFTALIVCICLLNMQTTAGNKNSLPSKTQYKCMPCGQDCDRETLSKPGKCNHCKMELVDQSTIKFNTIEPSDICEYVNSHPNTLLLDVRTKEEFEGKADPNFGTLKNAINIPLKDLESNLSLINAYTEKEMIVYCSHSHRSPQASYILNQNGFTKVINLAKGMSAVTNNSCKK